MRNRKRTISILTAALAALVLLVMPAAAAGNTQISGVGAFETPGQCTDMPSVIPPIVMSGDLVGCWYTTNLEVMKLTKSGSYQERGNETFVGCLADGTTCGSFDTRYHFEAKLAADFSEIRGHCEHPLIDGAGDFAGITGVIFMKDDPANAVFYYRGHYNIR